MRAVLGVVVAVLVCGLPALCAGDEMAQITSETALSQARSNRELAQELWRTSWEACVIGDTLKLTEVMQDVNKTLHQQPQTANSQFGSCRQLLLDVSFANGACFTGRITAHEMSTIKRNWAKDTTDCEAEIAFPSHQTSRSETLTDAEWEAAVKADGASDADIDFMREIRSK
jgi:hypothetical protein